MKTKKIISTLTFSIAMTMTLALSFTIALAQTKDEIEEAAVVSFPIIEEKAKSGDAEYQLKLGDMYLHGKGVEKDNEKAVSWIRESAKTNADAQIVLGVLYLKGDLIARDKEKGVALINQSLAKDDAATLLLLYYIYGDFDNAYGVTDHEKSLDMLEKFLQSKEVDQFEGIASLQYILAISLINGYDVEQDYDRAFPWLLKAYDGNIVGALERLPDMYRYGLGTPQNYEQAFLSQKRAYELFPRDKTIIKLSAMYYCGMGTEQNIEKSEALLIEVDYRTDKYRSRARVCYEVGNYELAKESLEIAFYEDDYGNEDSAAKLGGLYEKEHNYTKAVEWYTKASEKGDDKARTNLALLYTKGLGTEVNYHKAMQLHQLSADNGNSVAINNIGDMYENGYGVPVDYSKAKEYYMQAVAQDEPAGYLSMGQLYKLGRGVEKDLNIAKDWYGQACDMELQVACDEVAAIEGQIEKSGF